MITLDRACAPSFTRFVPHALAVMSLVSCSPRSTGAPVATECREAGQRQVPLPAFALVLTEQDCVSCFAVAPLLRELVRNRTDSVSQVAVVPAEGCQAKSGMRRAIGAPSAVRWLHHVGLARLRHESRAPILAVRLAAAPGVDSLRYHAIELDRFGDVRSVLRVADSIRIASGQ